MGRYLALPILGLSAALTASVVPHVIDVFVALIGSFAPALGGSRGQLSLVMLFVLCWSVHADLTESLIWALVGGLALDLLSALPLGASSIALVLMAFAVNSAARQLLRVRLLFLAAITPLATLFLAAWTLGALALLGYSYDILAYARWTLLPTMLINLLAVLPLYGLTRILQRRLKGGLNAAPQSLSPGAERRIEA